MNGTRFSKLYLFLFILTVTIIPGGSAWAKMIYVINTNDSGDGSFRKAISTANASAGIDQIYFLVSGTIKVKSELPPITSPVIINSSNACSSTVPIQLLGVNSLSSGLNFQSASQGSWVRGLAIGGFGTGVVVNGLNGFILECSYIGTNSSGTTAVPNGIGVNLKGFAQNIDIGSSFAKKNIIASNQSSDILMEQGVQNVRIKGNYIGVGKNGSAIGYPNQAGISLFQDTNVAIGGNFGTEGNVISNHDTGILLVDSSRVSMDGNLIGTNAAGTAAVPNTQGVVLRDGSRDIDIGHNAATRNIISGNQSKDIVMEFESQNVRVKGNYIGVGANGAALGLPNGNGIDVDSASDIALDGNVISNHGIGVRLRNTTLASLDSNVIGTDAAGNSPVPNQLGVVLEQGTYNVNIGHDLARRNIIAGNTQIDLSLKDTHDISVLGNYIGVGANGLGVGPLNDKGLLIESSHDLSIGETFGVAGNIISNHTSGLYINGSNGVVMLGNLIGTNPAGNAAVKNIEGVVVESSESIFFGATTAFRNIIAGNEQVDVLMNNGIHQSTFQNNYIGVGVNGAAISPMNEAGIALYSAQDVVIGGTVGLGNVISNHKSGVYTESSSRVNVYGNFIGTNPDGTAAVPNLKGLVLAGTQDVNIGSDSNHKNVIAFNQGSGVAVGPTSQNVKVLSNSIFNNQVPGLDMTNVLLNHTPSIDLNIDGIKVNDAGDLDGGANHTLNYVHIRSVQLIDNGATLKLQYKLDINTSEATQAKIQFFANPSYVNLFQGQLLIGEATLPATTSFTDVTIPLNGAVDPALITKVSASTTVDGIGTSEFTAGASVTVAAASTGTTPVPWSPVP